MKRTSLIAIGILLSSTVAYSSALRCYGNLQVYVSKAGVMKVMNEDYQGFSLPQEKVDLLGFGTNPKNIFLEVYPWIGIDKKDFKKKYENDFKVSYESDNETYFSVKLTGKVSGYSQNLQCHVLEENASKVAPETKSKSKKAK